MKIGELSKKAGIAASAIRYYESIGLISKPQRESGRRVYREESVLALKVIRKAQEMGFSVKEIKTLMSGFRARQKPNSWDKMAEAKIKELNERAKQLNVMISLLENGRNCVCLDLQSCKLLVANP